MRDVWTDFANQIYEYIVYIFAIRSSQTLSIKYPLWRKHRTLFFRCLRISKKPPKSYRSMQKKAYVCCFHGREYSGNIVGFYLFDWHIYMYIYISIYTENNAQICHATTVLSHREKLWHTKMHNFPPERKCFHTTINHFRAPQLNFSWTLQ